MDFTSIYNNTVNNTIIAKDGSRGLFDHCNIVNNVYSNDANDDGLIWCSTGRPVEFSLCVLAINIGKI